MNSRAEFLIRTLGLAPHPEGGWFRETYRAAEGIAAADLPARYGGPRCFSTAILFLLEGADFSALHRLRSDELWHFHEGGALEVCVIHPDGRTERVRLGPAPEHGDVFQAAVPAGAWFGARPAAPGGYVLVGCTVAPGFDFADFELAERAALAAAFPQHRALIEAMTR